MVYEKPQIVCADDASKVIQQMQKTAWIPDNENGTGKPPSTPPAYEANE